MYVTKFGGDINVILHMGELEKLENRETLTEELIRSGTLKPLGKPVYVKLRKTKRPHIDLKFIPQKAIITEDAESIEIIINEGYGYEYLARGPTFGVLAGSYGDKFLVSVANRYWETPNQ